MNFIPFFPHEDFIVKVWDWNVEPDYQRFWRGLPRMLMVDECRNLPSRLGCEVFYLLADDNPGQLIGLVTITDEPYQVSRFAVLIDKQSWGKGFGAVALKEIAKYCFHRKGARMILTDAARDDTASRRGLIKSGFRKCGRIPKYGFYQGKFEDINIYSLEREKCHLLKKSSEGEAQKAINPPTLDNTKIN